MNTMNMEAQQVMLLVLGSYVLVPLSVVCLRLLWFLCSKREKFLFLCDMEEYEYRKYHEYSIPHYLNHGEFLFAVKIYHKLYGQRRFPKPENEQEKQEYIKQE